MVSMIVVVAVRTMVAQFHGTGMCNGMVWVALLCQTYCKCFPTTKDYCHPFHLFQPFLSSQACENETISRLFQIHLPWMFAFLPTFSRFSQTSIDPKQWQCYNFVFFEQCHRTDLAYCGQCIGSILEQCTNAIFEPLDWTICTGLDCSCNGI